MNRKGKNWVSAIGLLFLFGACEKEIPEGVGEGKKVEIFFSTDITGYHTAGDLVRSGTASEPISTIIPLNGDFHLRATLVPDEEGELRVPVGFEDGQKICFEAYDVSSPATAVDSKIYSWSTSDGKFLPDTDPLGVVPDDGTTFRFVAYSYFGETGVAPAASNIDPVHDLVWGKTDTDQTITDTETSRTVTIHMLHQVARVKVKARSSIPSATITTLSGVKVEGGKLATLTPFDGDISWTGTATQTVDPFNTEWESEYRTVTPVGAAPMRLTIGSVKVSTSTTFSNKWTLFDSTLDAGTSYTLVVDLRRGNAFAYSNVYWDGAKLTFDTTDKGRQYQGLFFKWGSLIGISPAGASYSTSTAVYKPNAIATGTYASWGEIPCWDSSNDVGNPNTNTWKGDICKQINSDYRLPKNGEFGTDNSASQTDWVKVSGHTSWGGDLRQVI